MQERGNGGIRGAAELDLGVKRGLDSRGLFVLELSPGNFRLGTFAWILSLESHSYFHLSFILVFDSDST